MLDEEPCRRQFSLQQRAEAETRGNLRKGGERFALRVCNADAFEPQIELTGPAIDAEASPGNRDLRPAGGPVRELLDQWGQRAEVDRSLRQTPQAKPAQQDQRRRGCAEPRQNAVSPATDPPGRAMMSELLDADGRFAATIPLGVPALTGAPQPASLPAPAGLTG